MNFEFKNKQLNINKLDEHKVKSIISNIIKEKELALAAKDQEVTGLNERLKMKDQEVTGLNERLSQELAGLKESLVAKDQELAGLKESLKMKDQELEKLNNKINKAIADDENFINQLNSGKRSYKKAGPFIMLT